MDEENTKIYTYSKLPKLMPPDLNDTLKTFMDFAEPLQTPNQLEETKKVIVNFLNSEESRKLQSLLQQRAETLNNWITPWWLDIVYLLRRIPLPTLCPSLSFPPMGYSGQEAQIETAARIIQAALKFHHEILNNELPEDKSGEDPLDMNQYKLIFGSTRIPRKIKDEFVPGCSREFGKHILVTRNGHSFHVPVYDEQGNILGTDAIIVQLRDHVVPKSEIRINRPVNLLTAGDREEWAGVYTKLKRKNPKSIESYEKSLFVLCLDSEVQHDSDISQMEDQMRQMLTGGGSDENGINRWFDKTIQINVGFNGYSGLTYEHTPAEGPPIATLVEHIYTDLKNENYIQESSTELIDFPHEITFDLENKDKAVIEVAAKQFDQIADNMEVRCMSFEDFGKDILKKAKVSPDGFLQISFQVTFYKLHRSFPSTCETATLRKFQDGRSETIRLPNKTSVIFTKAFIDDKDKLSLKDLSTLLRTAIEAHKTYSTRCMQGKGMDRHLTGLKLIALENEFRIPEILRTEAYRKMMYFKIRTSQLPTRSFIPMGFAPLMPDGYGISYNPQEHSIIFTITAFNSCAKTSARRFIGELKNVLNELRDLLISDSIN